MKKSEMIGLFSGMPDDTEIIFVTNDGESVVPSNTVVERYSGFIALSLKRYETPAMNLQVSEMDKLKCVDMASPAQISS